MPFRRRSLLTMLLFVVVSGLLVEAAAPANITWLKTPIAGFEQARKTGQPMLMYFTSDSCTYCRKLERDVWSSSTIASQIQSKYIAVKVNATQNPQLASAHDVQAYPTVLVLSPEGIELSRIKGYTSATSMQQTLDKALKQVSSSAMVQATGSVSR